MQIYKKNTKLYNSHHQRKYKDIQGKPKSFRYYKYLRYDIASGAKRIHIRYIRSISEIRRYYINNRIAKRFHLYWRHIKKQDQLIDYCCLDDDNYIKNTNFELFSIYKDDTIYRSKKISDYK